MRIPAMFTVALCLAAGASAVHGDEKRIGGDWCVGETGTDTGFQLYSQTGVLFSGSSSTRAYVCPLIRDNVSTTTGLTGATVYFTTPSGVTASMKLCSMNLYSGVLECTTKAQTGGGDSSLTWDSDDVDVSHAYDSYYYLRVEFSGGAAGELIAVEWTES
jgi:hypothetical protein